MKRNPLTLIIGAVLIVIFGLLLFTFQVRITDVAVVTTFGKATSQITEPRPFPFFKWPWPIQSVYKFDRRIQIFEDKATEDITADGNNVVTMAYVGWRIADPMAFFPKFRGSVTEAEKQLDGMVRSARSGIVGRHPLSDFVNANVNAVKFDAIEAEMKDRLQSQLQTNNCGIQIEFLGLKKLSLPESVTTAVFERMASERQVLVSESQNAGEAEAQKIRSDAERKAAEMLANADAEATRIRGLGEAAAAESLPVFQQNPELANFLLRLNALEQSLKERSTLIFDQRTPPFDLFSGVSTNLTRP